MSYLNIFAAANNPDFHARCRVATWKAAQDIINEDESTLDHAMRAEWASRVLTNNTSLTDVQLAMQVLRNVVIAADPNTASDDDIQFQVLTVLPNIIAIG